jgi:hypothetical protein
VDVGDSFSNRKADIIEAVPAAAEAQDRQNGSAPERKVSDVKTASKTGPSPKPAATANAPRSKLASPNPSEGEVDTSNAEKRIRSVAASLFEEDESLPTPKKPKMDDMERSVSPKPPNEAQIEAQRALLARIAAKMDLDKGFESDNHSETSTSPRRIALAAAEEIAAAPKSRRRDNRYMSQKSMSPGTDAVEIVKEELDKYYVFGSDARDKTMIDPEEPENMVVLEFPGEGATER